MAVATVLTVYGIETNEKFQYLVSILVVATVLTVYGIETIYTYTKTLFRLFSCNSSYRLRY